MNPRGLETHAGLVEARLQGDSLLLLFERSGLRLQGLLDVLAATVAVARGARFAAIGLDIALHGLDALVDTATAAEQRRDQGKAEGSNTDNGEKSINNCVHRGPLRTKDFLLLDVGALQRLDQVGFLVEVAGALGKVRLGDAGGAVAADQVAVRSPRPECRKGRCPGSR